jgi:hypothetical protein
MRAWFGGLGGGLTKTAHGAELGFKRSFKDTQNKVAGVMVHVRLRSM